VKLLGILSLATHSAAYMELCVVYMGLLEKCCISVVLVVAVCVLFQVHGF